MAEYVSSSAQCPFYQEEQNNRKTVVCEGVAKGSNTCLAFQTKEASKKYREKHCYYNYKDCLICNMLYSKYNT